jgi:hypothetical protein
VRKLLRSLAVMAILGTANAVVDAATLALRPGHPDAGRGAEAGGPDRPQLEPAGVVVTTQGAGFNPGPVDDSFLPRPSLEGIEAECRYRMAAVAGMPEPRGFDTGKAKQRAREALDESLDLYNLVKDAIDDAPSS